MRLGLAALALGLVLTIFPALDIAFSELFFARDKMDFPLGDPLYNVSQVVQFIFRWTPYVVLGALVAAFIPLLNQLLPSKRLLAHFLVCIILVPIFVVNDVFKDQFGRARPYKVEEFGGELKFTGAFRVSDQCAVNCSFVSGDAAGGFTFLALAFAARKRRRLWCWSAAGLGTAIGLVRIMEGRHFLSDVVVAGVVTAGCTYLIYLAFYRLSSTEDDQPDGEPNDAEAPAEP